MRPKSLSESEVQLRSLLAQYGNVQCATQLRFHKHIDRFRARETARFLLSIQHDPSGVMTSSFWQGDTHRVVQVVVPGRRQNLPVSSQSSERFINVGRQLTVSPLLVKLCGVQSYRPNTVHTWASFMRCPFARA